MIYLTAPAEWSASQIDDALSECGPSHLLLFTSNNDGAVQFAKEMRDQCRCTMRIYKLVETQVYPA